jgi:ACR3 family arsenite efflux pump ArsB
MHNQIKSIFMYVWIPLKLSVTTTLYVVRKCHISYETYFCDWLYTNT